jgi:hypothetical protein
LPEGRDGVALDAAAAQVRLSLPPRQQQLGDLQLTLGLASRLGKRQ